MNLYRLFANQRKSFCNAIDNQDNKKACKLCAFAAMGTYTE